VIVSIASGVYVKSLRVLASTAAEHGFRCVATLPYTAEHADELRGPHVHVLPTPHPPLLPRPNWCNTTLYGWRRTGLYKMRLWRVVLDAGLDILSIDANFRMVFNPMPYLLAIRAAPCERCPWLPADLRPGGGPVDVVALHDGPANKLLNIGLWWMRSTNATRTVAWRSENRTWGGWDQFIVNEELQASRATRA
jgi:hypothetical protein